VYFQKKSTFNTKDAKEIAENFERKS